MFIVILLTHISIQECYNILFKLIKSVQIFQCQHFCRKYMRSVIVLKPSQLYIHLLSVVQIIPNHVLLRKMNKRTILIITKRLLITTASPKNTIISLYSLFFTIIQFLSATTILKNIISVIDYSVTILPWNWQDQIETFHFFNWGEVNFTAFLLNKNQSSYVRQSTRECFTSGTK